MKRTILLTPAALLTYALIGAATPASAQTPLSACGALSKGSYVLTKNLTTSESCFNLINNFITLDLNGFVITGDGGSGDYGIRSTVANLTGIEIRNGTITNFERAINLSATGTVIERIRAVRNTGTGIVSAGSSCVIRDTVARENGGTGMSLGLSCVATGNSATANGNTGLSAGTGTVVSGNVARDNEGIGIQAGNGSTVVNNTARFNGSYGIYAFCPVNLVGNAATENGGTEMLLNGASCGNSHNVAVE